MNYSVGSMNHLTSVRKMKIFLEPEHCYIHDDSGVAEPLSVIYDYVCKVLKNEKLHFLSALRYHIFKIHTFRNTNMAAARDLNISVTQQRSWIAL